MAKTTVMLVDDQESIRELVKGVLENAGFKVILAASGYECLEKLEKTKPDLILMDIMMPGMDGKETVKKIRRNPETKDLAVAFLTVSVASGFAAKTLKELGVIDYINKPFENEELIERVNKLLGTLKK